MGANPKSSKVKTCDYSNYCSIRRKQRHLSIPTVSKIKMSRRRRCQHHIKISSRFSLRLLKSRDKISLSNLLKSSFTILLNDVTDILSLYAVFVHALRVYFFFFFFLHPLLTSFDNLSGSDGAWITLLKLALVSIERIMTI